MHERKCGHGEALARARRGVELTRSPPIREVTNWDRHDEAGRRRHAESNGHQVGREPNRTGEVDDLDSEEEAIADHVGERGFCERA